MKLYKLLENIRFRGDFDLNAEITGICSRVQDCKRGVLYVAVKGKKFDGTEHIDEAFARGAVCVISEKGKGQYGVCIVENALSALSFVCAAMYGNPQNNISLIGITGTNGKTTTANITSHILSQCGFKSAVIGSVEFENTTPEPEVLFPHLRRLVDEGYDYAVIEASSQGLCQRRLDACHFKTGAFLNLGRDHLDYHSDLSDYFKCKKRLYDLCDTFLTNADDSFGRKFRGKNVKTFSVLNDADFRVNDILFSESGSEFTFSCGEKNFRTGIPLIGEFNVYNALAALSLCLNVGVDAEAACSALTKKITVEGRMEKIESSAPFTVYIDYAHTPQALKSALTCLQPFVKGRLCCLFGCGGDRDKDKRALMGEIADLYADMTFLTSDNPRSEDATDIMSDIAKGFKSCRYMEIEDRKQAIEAALNWATAGDTVIIAGKGHEKYQIKGKEKLFFDDKETVIGILRGLGYCPCKERSK